MPGLISAGIKGIPKDVQEGIIKDIFPKVESAMRNRINRWKGSGTKGGDVSVANQFSYTEYPRKGGVLQFVNTAIHADALISGVKPHWVPIQYIDGWVRRMGIRDSKDARKLPRGVWVGGPKSRIKEGRSERDFWTPVIKKFFDVDGILKEKITNKVYIGLKKRIK